MADLLRDRLQSSLGAAYTLERELGGGGMSCVFVAREEALGRDVVVKVLSPELAEGLSAERFTREIRLAAALQEPHIVPVLAAGVTVDGLPYYTMPFVRGDSLRSRIARGPVPLGEAVSILRDVAAALEHAHAHGVVHRDVKPENVLLSGRTAVVTDFGIAKAISAARTHAGGPEARGATLTRAGTSLGTPAYMAPEQAAGDDVDARADLYAWGVIAYELLAGAHPFAGRGTSQQLIAAHIAEAPRPLGAAAPAAPPPLAALVMRCLAKRPADRPADARAVIEALDAVAPRGAGEARRGLRGRGLALAAVGAVALAALGAWTLRSARRPPVPFVVGVTTQVTASPELELDAAISPDGRLLAYVTTRGGALRVVVRQLAGGRTVVVADSGGPQRAPRWSPDGTQLVYGADGTVFVVPALGGTPRALVHTAPDYLRLSNPTPVWSPDGRYVAYRDTSGILVRALDGGEARRLVAGSDLHSPAWSPDGRRLAYVAGNPRYVTIVGNTSPSAIWTVSSDGGAPQRVTEAQHLNASPVWTPDGRALLYVSNIGGTRDVYEVALDRDGTTAGEPSRLTTGLEPYTISLSADGRLLAYSALRLRSNVWSAAIGTDAGAPRDSLRQLTHENQRVEGLDLSADGRTLLFDANRFGNADIFRVDIDGGEPVRLTADPADDFEPVRSPDGRQIAFYSTRTGNKDVYVMDADGGNVERVTSMPGQERFPTWSPDGRRLAFDADVGGSSEVYVATRRPEGGWTPPMRLTTGGAATPRWSPDGKWISAIYRGALLLIPADGAPAGPLAPRVLVPAPHEGPGAVFSAWGPDPSHVLYATIDQQPLAWSYYSVPVAGGPPRLLLRLDARAHGTGGVTFATDGRRLLFTLSADDADVWTMELHRP